MAMYALPWQLEAEESRITYDTVRRTEREDSEEIPQKGRKGKILVSPSHNTVNSRKETLGTCSKTARKTTWWHSTLCISLFFCVSTLFFLTTYGLLGCIVLELRPVPGSAGRHAGARFVSSLELGESLAA